MKKLLLCALAIPLSTTAMDLGNELVQAAQIGLGGAAAAYAYSRGAEWLSKGIDSRATLNLNTHNFTRGTPEAIHSGMDKWGALGTLWIGVPLIVAARLGTHQLEAQELIKPAAIAYGLTAASALAAGSWAYWSSKRIDYSSRIERSLDRATLNSRIVGTLCAPVGLIGWVLYKRATQ